MPHWAFHALVDLACVAVGLLFGVPIGTSIGRERERFDRNLERTKQAIENGAKAFGRVHRG